MYKGKRVRRGVSRKKPALLVASLALLLSVSVMGTLAFLVAKSGTVTNTFTLDTVPIKVYEDIETESGTKNDVRIENVGTAKAYIRAKVIATWAEVDDNNEPTGNIYGVVPAEGTDYSITWSKEGWEQGADGYYYYTEKAIAPTEKTGKLFTGCALKSGVTPPAENYVLSVEIIAQSIQAGGEDADGNKPVVQAWGLANGGSVKSVSDQGVLNIQQ